MAVDMVAVWVCGSILCGGMGVWQYIVWRYGCVAVYCVEVWVCGSIYSGGMGVWQYI